MTNHMVEPILPSYCILYKYDECSRPSPYLEFNLRSFVLASAMTADLAPPFVMANAPAVRVMNDAF